MKSSNVISLAREVALRHPVLKLYRINDVAKMLVVSRATVYRLMREGRLQYVQIGPSSRRITAQSVEALIAGVETRSQP